MIRSALSAFAFAVLIYAHASSDVKFTPEAGPACVRTASLDSRLRSAFLLRASGEDTQDNRLPPAQEVQRLDDHFDAVLELLAGRRDAALEIALNRLETRRGEHWSASERDVWRQRLATERETNLARLRDYQRRRRFPVNEHDDQRAVPVFVDHYDTACAVGHLMRESGWTDAVAGIQAENNLVYVTDVREGPLVEWVAYSGLLQEEAALIQPAYGISPYSPAYAISSLTAPDSLSHADWAIGAFADATLSQKVDMIVNDSEISSLLTSHGLSLFPNYFPLSHGGVIWVSPHTGPAGSEGCFGCGTFTPIYDTWLDVRGTGFPGLATAGAVGTPPEIQNPFDLNVYRFELSALAPNDRIESISLFSNYTIANAGFGSIGLDGTGFGFARMRVFQLGAGGALLGTATIEAEPGSVAWHLDGRDTLTFAPQRRIRVEVTALAGLKYNIYALGHDVNVITVPEPTSRPTALAGILHALLLACVARHWGVVLR
jgi:hypothetical protein